MIDVAVLKEIVLHKGFCVIENLFPEDEVYTLRKLLESAVEQHNQNLRSDTDRDMVHNCHEYSLKFIEPYQHPLIDDMLSQLLGYSYIIYAFQSSSLPPNGSNYARRIHCDSSRVIENYVTNIGVIITLDDYTKESGPIEFLPQSFKSTSKPTSDIFASKSEKIICNAGSCIIFNARTFHREGINHLSRYRHSLTCNFCRCYMKQRFDYVRMAEASGSILRMTCEQRKLIGYNVRVPTSLDEFFLPSNKRMYLPNQE
ncbi:phytanoyl-CoA dioxygenase family protein [Cyanobium sp. Aljojuca 7D2]|uniref:phytanoyl-CoA dioxygenase family protein n=1 Tax=Cyanobium sp. Aljojuca 7D2 TaxID=2823698 RepID=UPI003965662C|nr:phytanoyl-CoA dioxygenase family protein [Cyanobium sp. Aljojuca 7D2]